MLFLVSFIRILGGSLFAICVALVHCLSWSSAYCMSRTLANSTETSFIVIGAYFLLKAHTNTHINKNNNNQKSINQCNNMLDYWSSAVYFNLAVVIASVSVFCRPTSIIIWVRSKLLPFLLEPKYALIFIIVLFYLLRHHYLFIRCTTLKNH